MFFLTPTRINQNLANTPMFEYNEKENKGIMVILNETIFNIYFKVLDTYDNFKLYIRYIYKF